MSLNSFMLSVQKVRLDLASESQLTRGSGTDSRCSCCTAQQESESRVISHFVENMSELMLAVHDYERRVTSVSFTVFLISRGTFSSFCSPVSHSNENSYYPRFLHISKPSSPFPHLFKPLIQLSYPSSRPSPPLTTLRRVKPG